MKYKILSGTELYKKLLALSVQIRMASDLAQTLAIELGGTGAFTNGGRLSGGIDAIQFKEEPDKKLWMRRGEKWQRLFYPKKANKEALDKINALPVIENEVLNDLVNFKQAGGVVTKDGDLAFVHTVGFYITDEVALIEVYETIKGYEPAPDMIEITVSEFNNLKPKNDARE